MTAAVGSAVVFLLKRQFIDTDYIYFSVIQMLILVSTIDTFLKAARLFSVCCMQNMYMNPFLGQFNSELGSV